MRESELTVSATSTVVHKDPDSAGPTGVSRRLLWPLIAVVPLVGIAGLTRLVSSDRANRTGNTPLPVLASAPQFSLSERGHRTVTLGDLGGYVWVADFIFTRCAGPCPELTLRMRSLQNALLERQKEVKLVSFTLDPEYDTPRVLEAYADKNHADRDLWWFLTGDDGGAIHKLVQEGFLQTVVPGSGGNPIIHSTYFVLVDRQGQIRGFYEGLDPATKARLLGDIEVLLAESGG